MGRDRNKQEVWGGIFHVIAELEQGKLTERDGRNYLTVRAEEH